MKMKAMVVALTAFVMGGVANAITSEEIANVLDFDLNSGVVECDADIKWGIDTNVFHNGGCSLRSASIGHSTSTSFNLYVNVDVPMMFKF